MTTSNLQHLPTLEQVLTRKTQPPVCLYNFYIVMRDRLYMEEVLDFYLDVQHHEQLWRRYIRSMHKTGLLSEDDLVEGFHSPRVLSRLSNYSGDDEKPTESKLPSRDDIAQSAEGILLRYLVPHAAKELTQVPQQLKDHVRQLIEQEGRDDPAVFGECKKIAFDVMQRVAYPKFLRLKVWGNVTLWQQLGRLVLGLFSLMAGFTTGLSLIFLGYPQWGIRWCALLPIWVGVLNCMVFLTGLDPLWVLIFNTSETTTFHFNFIKERPVRRILFSRSLWLLLVSLVVSVALSVIFAAVPPRRL
ncbi:hypothetical protein DM01DRAFT_1386156 [Hesseltinella vesiculosa]|uniref:RGS domain-containing protein n=1 Tax=Hesseltinella vesiculosa TaxID=101127 RepID=A0A1X2G6M0_9FUNG|nr:hypothetical protein DM01DRAFT_1386156 [Hesseltinella vesiculosa]